MEFVGHLKQRKLLSQMLASDTLPSTLLFSGVPGIGKKLIAQEISRILLCEDAKDRSLLSPQTECHCSSCRVLRAGNAPDFHLVECSNRDETNTDSVRALLSSLHLKSFSGSATIVLLNDVELLSPQAANALLKVLEEPRAGLYFILITRSRMKVLQTILSRCLCIHFERLSDAEILSVLPSHTKLAEIERSKLPKSISLRDLAVLADGSFENVGRLIDNLGDWENVQQKLQEIAGGNLSCALQWASELAGDKESLSHQLSLIRIACRKLMLETAREAQPLAGNAWEEHWAYLLQGVIDAQKTIFERNISALYTLQFLLTEFVNSLSLPMSRVFPAPLLEATT